MIGLYPAVKKFRQYV